MAKRGLYKHHLPAVFSYRFKRTIGVLGGSFNPAHEGHIALSKAAMQHGKFDQIWWLVSPQNPLKSDKDMAEFQERLAYARTLAQDLPWLRVFDLESQQKHHYSYDTMMQLRKRAPLSRFTWLMGTDNLIQFPQWYRAKDMARLVPFMVFRRKASFYPALGSKGRHYFKPATLQLISTFSHNSSATALRQQGFWQNRP